MRKARRPQAPAPFQRSLSDPHHRYHRGRRQATLGDLVNAKYESFGLLQVRAPVHTGTFPWSQLSTAFNVDYALAWRRACLEGYMEWIPPSAKGDEWGCIGLWFSGRWHDPGAETYISQTKNWLARKTWLQSGF